MTRTGAAGTAEQDTTGRRTLQSVLNEYGFHLWHTSERSRESRGNNAGENDKDVKLRQVRVMMIDDQACKFAAMSLCDQSHLSLLVNVTLLPALYPTTITHPL